ncbi:5200_t:CDS:10, partial [Paraglomus occultum]
MFRIPKPKRLQVRTLCTARTRFSLPTLPRHFQTAVRHTDRENYLKSRINAAVSSRYMILRRHASTAETSSDNVLQPSRKLNRMILISAVTIIGGITLAVLDYKHTENEAAAHERRELESSLPTGGPKNLPIALHMTDEKGYETNKPRLVILGTGWGAVSVLKELEKDQYCVTIISPINYFLFTPLLPSATVGTLETRSLLEPIRSIARKINGHFLEAKAVDVCFDEKLVEVKSVNGDESSFYVPYDKLIIAVGSQSITHGVEGIEHCHFLKTINDARGIRKKIMDNFEKASLPTTSAADKKRLLSFVVCGGGPTGVEFAAELYDFLTEDVVKYFPRVLRDEVSVSIIQSQDHILNTYDAKISHYTEKKFARDHINVITNARVEKVEPDKILYKMKKDGEVRGLPFGLVLWSTGIAMNPLTKAISEKLPEQKNTRALITDQHLRLKGAPMSTVYAIGDCATVENPKLVQQLVQFFVDADTDKNGCLDYK